MTGWQERLRAAREAAKTGAELERQAVRDASADGATPTEIATALGVRNRQRVYDILADAEHGEILNPVLTPVAYLRGAGIPPQAWTRVERAVRARGFRTTHDRLAAWHLCRGGTPVVLIDFSDDLDDNPPAPGGGHWHGYNRFTRVGLCRARYGDDEHLELVLLNGGRRDEPWGRNSSGLDEGILARLAAEALIMPKDPAAAGEIVTFTP